MMNLMRTPACLLLTSAVALASLLGPARPASGATPQQVNEAIDKARDYILSQMKNNNWEKLQTPPKYGAEGLGQADPEDGWQWGGTTACAVYGLLAAGVSPKDPRLAPAIEWLKTAKIQGHYACSMRAQVWTFLDEREGKLASEPDFKLLLNGLLADGQRLGYYSYYTEPSGKPQAGWMDRSVSQICVLGMWACEQAGQEVPRRYWEIVDAAWKKGQKNDGGWNYQDSREVSGTMTAAGIATLYITQDYLMQGNKWDRCIGGTKNEHIERGLAWMDKNVDKLLRGGAHHHYMMYGIERIGVASGRKYFGTTDWYAVGAEELVKTQNKNGSWGGAGGNHNPKGVPDTVFGIMFLVRGRAPVIMNKLEYQIAAKPGQKAIPEPWNQRPRDAANFAHWAGKMIERYLNWQIVNLKVSADELHDAPILYIAGSEPLAFNDEEMSKLRTFIEGGGMILANADCGDAGFAKSVSDLGAKLFPKYEFRQLPPTHAIYTEQQFRPARWKVNPRVMGMTNGVRELMLLIPDADPARAWQTRSEKTKQEMYELMQNIFLYAVDKSNLQERGQTYVVKSDPKAQPTRKIEVVRLEVGDNFDPEPGGWKRLAAVMRNQAKVDLSVQMAKLGDGKLGPGKVGHITGTTKFKLSPDNQKQLKDFVNAGGTLVIDAAGGSQEFADAAEAELGALFGAGKVSEVLPPDHALFNQPNAKIEKFGYRTYVKGKVTGALNVPRLRAMTVNGRVAVIFSREDISGGLVGQPVDGVLGYDPDTATNLMRNILLYATGGKGPVAAQADAK